MMGMIGKTAMALALAASLAACGSSNEPQTDAAEPAADEVAVASADAASTPASEAAPAGARPAAFAQCAACHAVEAGKNGVGPTLFGIVGRAAGTVPGFAYSDANKNSGVTWDEATLDSYLTAPMKNMPGTKMAFAGLTDAAKRKEVIDYLKTLK